VAREYGQYIKTQKEHTHIHDTKKSKKKNTFSWCRWRGNTGSALIESASVALATKGEEVGREREREKEREIKREGGKEKHTRERRRN